VRATLEGLASDPVASREPALLAAATAWLEGRLLVADGRPVAGAGRLLRAAWGHAGFRARLAGAPGRRLAALMHGGGR
jgi:hypothetical protein